MIKIGITGGIGSGKSVVSEIFHLYGVPLYNADKEAKKLNDTSPIIREQLTSQFGENLYINNKLNRKKLASIIFHDNQKLAIANGIIHPELAKHFNEWCSQREKEPLIVLEAALLIEAGFYRFVDKIIMVQAPEELRVQRVIQRDQSTTGDVEARIKSQLPEKEKSLFADFIICNDNKQSLIKQVNSLMEKITEREL